MNPTSTPSADAATAEGSGSSSTNTTCANGSQAVDRSAQATDATSGGTRPPSASSSAAALACHAEASAESLRRAPFGRGSRPWMRRRSWKAEATPKAPPHRPTATESASESS